MTSTAALQRVSAGSAADIAKLRKKLDGLNKELALDMTQAAADIAGLVDPTPISDGISAAMSVARGDWLGAGLSLVSMIPGLRDAVAKPLKGTKLGKKIAQLENEIGTVTAQLAKLTQRPLAPVRAAARASRQAVTHEVLSRLPKNWVQVRGILGQKLDKTKQPPQYYTKRLASGKIVISRKKGQADDDLVAPLGVDGTGRVFLRQGANRLSDPTLMRKNYAKMHGKLPSGQQIHHLVPDNLIRDHPLGQAAERAGVSLDRGENLLGLPGKMAYTPTIDPAGHWSSHSQYDAIVTGLLEVNRKALEKTYGSLDLVSPAKLKEAMDEIADEMKDRIKKGKVPLKDGRLAAAPAGAIEENQA